jgi:hypothetical protein
MTELLFDTPWWLPALIAGVGVVLFWMGNNRQERKVRNFGAALLVLALLVVGVSYFVDTPRERAIKNTRSLVKSVEARDWPAMTSLMDPRCAFESYGNRDEIVSAARIAAERFGLKSINITSLQAEQVDTLITVHLDVISEQDVTMGRPFPTSWQLDYQKTANGWSLRNIEVLESRQAGSQAAVKQNLPSVK